MSWQSTFLPACYFNDCAAVPTLLIRHAHEELLAFRHLVVVVSLEILSWNNDSFQLDSPVSDHTGVAALKLRSLVTTILVGGVRPHGRLDFGWYI